MISKKIAKLIRGEHPQMIKAGITIIVAGFIAISAAPAKPPTDIQLRELVPGVWLHTSYYTYPDGTTFPSNGLLVQEGDELILIDTAWGELETVKLLEKIASTINLPISKAIVTHSHGDRLAGADALKSRSILVFSHPNTQKLATDYGLPVPDQVFTDLTQRGAMTQFESLQVFYPGPAHSVDNIMVWLPKQRILFGGCAIRASASTSAGNLSHADLKSWQQIMYKLQTQFHAAEIVIPGHGEPAGLELIAHTLKLVTIAAQ